jgi:hypothetical protein
MYLLKPSRGVAAAVALVSLTACGGGGNGSVLHSGKSLVLVDAKPKFNEPVVGVAWGGRVTMAGHCLGIDGATVIWPHGTKITLNKPLTIDVPGIGPVKVDDYVSGGASADDPGPLRALPKGIDAVPSGCPTDRAVYFSAN